MSQFWIFHNSETSCCRLQAVVCVCAYIDVVAPKLVCPGDLEVTVADWGDNSTIVHYDAQPPQISDNSGQSDYRVIGVSDGQVRFPIGSVTLEYEAFDAAGNTATCSQHIHVRGVSQLGLKIRKRDMKRRSANLDVTNK